MVKVLERGKLRSETVHQIRCTGCDSLLEFTEHEAKYVGDQRDGDALVITCPVCHKEVWKAV